MGNRASACWAMQNASVIFVKRRKHWF